MVTFDDKRLSKIVNNNIFPPEIGTLGQKCIIHCSWKRVLHSIYLFITKNFLDDLLDFYNNIFPPEIGTFGRKSVIHFSWRQGLHSIYLYITRDFLDDLLDFPQSRFNSVKYDNQLNVSKYKTLFKIE